MKERKIEKKGKKKESEVGGGNLDFLQLKKYYSESFSIF